MYHVYKHSRHVRKKTIHQNLVIANSKGTKKKLHYKSNSLCKGRNILMFYQRGFKITLS
jgi:hypothetical protein